MPRNIEIKARVHNSDTLRLTVSEGKETLEKLISKLGIERKDLIGCEYIDLMSQTESK